MHTWQNLIQSGDTYSCKAPEMDLTWCEAAVCCYREATYIPPTHTLHKTPDLEKRVPKKLQSYSKHLPVPFTVTPQTNSFPHSLTYKTTAAKSEVLVLLTIL